jgi:hypothetical protein
VVRLPCEANPSPRPRSTVRAVARGAALRARCEAAPGSSCSQAASTSATGALRREGGGRWSGKDGETKLRPGG